MAILLLVAISVALTTGSAAATTRCQRTYRDLSLPVYKRLVQVYERRNLGCSQAARIGSAVADAYERGLPVADFPPPPSGVAGGQGQAFQIHTRSYGTYVCLMTARGSDFVSANCTDTSTGAKFVRFTSLNHYSLWAGPPTWVACVAYDAQSTYGVKEPSRCAFHHAHTGYFGYTMVLITGIKWKHWGSSAATGVGTFRGNMNFHARATLRLSRLRTCPAYGSLRYYTELAINIQGLRSSTMPLDACA